MAYIVPVFRRIRARRRRYSR